MKPLPQAHPDTPTLSTLEALVRKLDAAQTPQFGTMNAAQMLQHCTAFHRLYLGESKVSMPLRWIARLLGPLFLRKAVVTSPTPTPRNLRTLDVLRPDPEAAAEFEAHREAYLETLLRVHDLKGPQRHVLYGETRAEDLQVLVRHHAAHHAHQFGLL